MDAKEEQYYHDIWGRHRYYAVKRAVYYAPFIYKFRPEFVPNSGLITMHPGHVVKVDPEILDECGDYLWKYLLYWSHHLYQGHLPIPEDKNPELWAMAASLVTVSTWEPVLSREDTIAEYPGEGIPPGMLSLKDVGLEDGLSVHQVYEILRANAQEIPIAVAGAAGGAQLSEGAERGSAPTNPGDENQEKTPQPKGGQEGQSSEASASAPNPAPADQKAESDTSGASAPQPDQDTAGGDGDQETEAGDQATDNSEEPSAGRPNPIGLAQSEAPSGEVQAEGMEAQVEGIIRDPQSGIAAGSLPSDMERIVTQEQTKYVVPIERLLARRVSRGSRGRLDYEMGARLSSRSLNHPDELRLPTLARGLPEVIYLVDDSGSMSQEMLAGALQIAGKVVKATATRLAIGNVGLHHKVERRDLNARRLRKVRMTHGGGTDMVACVQEANRTANGRTIVVFTDGIFGWPESRRELRGADVCWMVLEHETMRAPIPDWIRRDVVFVTKAAAYRALGDAAGPAAAAI